jgi:hypothetical protein
MERRSSASKMLDCERLGPPLVGAFRTLRATPSGCARTPCGGVRICLAYLGEVTREIQAVPMGRAALRDASEPAP